MQTLEHYTELDGGAQPPKGPRTLLFALAIVLSLGLSVLAIQTRLGVLLAMAVAIVVGSVLFAVRRAVTLIEVVAFLIHFDGIGVGPVTLGRVMSAVVILFLVYRLVVEKWRPPAVPTRHWIGPLALTTWVLVSGTWSDQIGAWMVGVGTVGLALGYYAAAGLLVDSYDDVRAFLRAYWYGGLFGAGAGIFGLLAGMRAFGFNGDANLFGVLAASMIPLTFYYRRNAMTSRGRLMYTLILLVVMVGASGAGSRSGVIGSALAFFGSLVYRPGVSVGRRLAAAVPAAIATAAVAMVLLFINPNTVQRGTDSSGRLDFWRVTAELISERPILGHGQRQINGKIPGMLATTPGTVANADKRAEVTSHNTWLDYLGNLGVIGFSMYASIIVVTAISFLRPRWKQTKEISGYLFLMMLPVLSGSMFLDLSNNKLAWSLIGLAGILQVPSWGRRYRGFFSRPPDLQPLDRFSAPRLARWDLKISRRFRVWILLGAILGGVTFASLATSGSTTYSATVSMFVPKLDAPPNLPFVIVDRARVSVIQTLVLSDAYAVELVQRSGVDVSPAEISKGVTVDRPGFGPYLAISFEDPDQQLVDAVGPHMLDSVDGLIEEGREFTIPELRDEIRPTIPGEQRYYTGPLFLPVSDHVSYGAKPPRVVWNFLVGVVSGAMIALGYTLFQQRKPRVSGEDNLVESVGLELWSHVGRPGRRRNAATGDQYSHIAVRAFEEYGMTGVPRRIVVAGPKPSRSTRELALGVAGALASLEHRVVLVDGQVKKPRLSRRLGFWRAPGVREIAASEVGLDRVLKRIKLWFLPRVVRRSLRGHRENLRFVSAGRVSTRAGDVFDPAWLDQLDESIVTVVLSPPLTDTVAVGPLLEWADVVYYDLVEGETVTFDAEDGALQVATFARGPAGVILSEV